MGDLGCEAKMAARKGNHLTKKWGTENSLQGQ